MLAANPERLLKLRKRLSNVSLFMTCLCEKIELGGNGARLRSAVQAGGREIELACLCRDEFGLGPQRGFESRYHGQLLRPRS